MVEVYLFSGAVLTFGGMIRRSEKSCKEKSAQSSSVDYTLLYMFQRLCTYFQDTGVLIFWGMYFRGIAVDNKFQQKSEGYLFS